MAMEADADGPAEENEQLEKADALRKDGNELLSKGQLAEAVRKYEDGLLAVAASAVSRPSGDEASPSSSSRAGRLETRASEARLALRLNAALAELKRGNFASAADHASGALAEDPDSVKALYRRGLARLRLAELGALGAEIAAGADIGPGTEDQGALGRADIERAAVLEPGNVEVRTKLKELRAAARAEQREGFKGLFSGDRALYDGPQTPEEFPPVLRDEGRASDHRLVLSAEHLAFSYVRGEPVLLDMDVHLRAGWCTGLVGNNASGKSTLARLLQGKQLRPWGGQIIHHTVDGGGGAAHGGGRSGFLSKSLLGSVSVLLLAALVPSAQKAWRRGRASLLREPELVAAVALLAVLLAALLALLLRWGLGGGGGPKNSVLHVSSEESDKESLGDSLRIEVAIGQKLPKRLSREERRRIVILMLKAGGFQMYNQETGQPVGSPEEYVDQGVRYGQLSGGQKHLIYVLRCFASRPDVLLCDELLGGLDHIRQPRVLRMLRRLIEEAGVAVLYISTELHQISIVCDSVGFQSGGRMVELGLSSEVLERPKHPVSKDYVGQYRSLPGFEFLGGKLGVAYAGLHRDAALLDGWLPPR